MSDSDVGMLIPTDHSSRALRVLSVTGGLLLLGGVTGAIAGAGVLALLAIVKSGPAVLPQLLFPLLWAAGFGALLGGVLGPLAAWLFLRHVPFGRMVLIATFGTILGGTLGFMLGEGMLQILGGSLAGFIGSVVALRGMTPRPARATD